jgi:hypothetical protein
LNQREQANSTFDKEMFAIIPALAKWKQYLLGAKFLVNIDHNSFEYFLKLELIIGTTKVG